MKEEVVKPDLETNRAINITYILAGILGKSTERLNKLLKATNSDLTYENRMYLNRVLDLSNKLVKSVDTLEKISILKCTDEAIYAHDTVQDQFYAIFLKLIEIIGSDELAEVRAWYLYKHLRHFKIQIEMPNLKHQEDMAFYGTVSKLEKGEFDLEQVLHCLEFEGKTNQYKEDGKVVKEG